MFVTCKRHYIPIGFTFLIYPRPYILLNGFYPSFINFTLNKVFFEFYKIAYHYVFGFYFLQNYKKSKTKQNEKGHKTLFFNAFY